VTVVSAVSTRARHARRTGSNPVGHSHAVLAQLVEAQVLGTWRSGFESPGRYHLPARSHRAGDAGRDPAGRRGLPDTQVLLGSTPRRPTGAYPLALIRRRKGNGTRGVSTRRPLCCCPRPTGRAPDF
jgi:hypothetical protein